MTRLALCVTIQFNGYRGYTHFSKSIEGGSARKQNKKTAILGTSDLMRTCFCLLHAWSALETAGPENVRDQPGGRSGRTRITPQTLPPACHGLISQLSQIELFSSFHKTTSTPSVQRIRARSDQEKAPSASIRLQ